MEILSSAPSVPRLGYLYSAPLVWRRPGSDTAELVEALDVDTERELLKQVLRDARRQIRFTALPATGPNISKTFSLGCRVIHFSAHGTVDALLLEEHRHGLSTGCGVLVPGVELIKSMGQSERASLVFVSACHSELIGNIFVEAGIKHVVAIEKADKVGDRHWCWGTHAYMRAQRWVVCPSCAS